jgi:hypothetical protein
MFDSNAPNTSAVPQATGDYAIELFTAAIGSFTFSSNSATLFVEVGSGEYLVSGLGTAGDTVNGHTLDTFGVRTSSPQITTTALPLTPPAGTYTYNMDFGLLGLAMWTAHFRPQLLSPLFPSLGRYCCSESGCWVSPA